MLQHRTIHDIKNARIVKIYDKKVRYKLLVDDVKLNFANTREVQSQLKFRAKYLEEVGQPIAKVSTAEWQAFLLDTFTKNAQATEDDLKPLFIQCLTDYCIKERHSNKNELLNGKVYWTAVCVIFTLKGFLKYVENKQEFKYCTHGWFFKMIKQLFNTRETSYRIEQKKCSVFRINLYSTRIPPSFVSAIRNCV